MCHLFSKETSGSLILSISKHLENCTLLTPTCAEAKLPGRESLPVPPILSSGRSQPSVHPALYHRIYAVCQVTFTHKVCKLNPRKAM